MALVYNCNDDVVVVAFVNGLQVSQSFYKHLVKYEVTRMRDILYRAHKTARSRIRPGTQSSALPKGRIRGRSQSLPSQIRIRIGLPAQSTYNLYRVLTLTVKTYMKALLNDRRAPDGHSDIL